MTEQQFLELKVGDMVIVDGKACKVSRANIEYVNRTYSYVNVAQNGKAYKVIHFKNCKNIQRL